MSERHNFEVAMKLAETGLHVFPCGYDKRPAPGFMWKLYATNDPRRVEAIWRYKDFMVGIHLGRSGLFVLDLDRHEGCPDGVAAFDALVDEHGMPPLAPWSKTPSGGFHGYFKQPEGRAPLGNSTGNLPRGIDVRGDGGFVIAVGWVKDDGTFYEAVAGTPDLAESFKAGTVATISSWLVEIIEAGKSHREQPDHGHLESSGAHAGSPSVLLPEGISPDRPPKYARAALERYSAELARTPEGGRNYWLNKRAYTLAGYAWMGGFDEAEACADLLDACRQNGLVAADGIAVARASFRSGWVDELARGPLPFPPDPPRPKFVFNPKPKPT